MGNGDFEDFGDPDYGCTPEERRRRKKRRQERARRKRRRVDNPEWKARQDAIGKSKRYGINVEDVAKLQSGPCVICKTTDPSPGIAFNMDHCHFCNGFRGVTCNSCNNAVGGIDYLIKKGILEDAIKYVKKHLNDNCRGNG